MNIGFTKNIFLKNLGVKQTIFKNTFWLATAQAVSYLLKLVLIIYVARILGATDYGKFNFALSFVALFAIIADFGLSRIATREFAREKEREREIFSLFSLKIILALATFILILIGSFFITPDPVARRLILIFALYTVFTSLGGIIFAFFRARQKMEYQAITQIFEAVLVTGAGFLVIFKLPSVINLGYAYLFAGLAAFVFILSVFRLRAFPLRISWHLSVWKRFLSMSWPLALAGIFGSIYTQTDSVMMGYLSQMAQTGWYNAAYKIVGVAIIPAGLVSQAFFPALSLAFSQSKEKLQEIWNSFINVMVFLAVPIVAVGIALSRQIILYIYNPSYSPSVLALQILIVMAGLSFISLPFSQLLIAANRQKKIFWVTLFGAIGNVVLNIILIPRYSLYGAAAATVATSVITFTIFLWFAIKFTTIKPFNLNLFSNLIGALLSALPMYFFISRPLAGRLNIFLSLSIGLFLYSVSLFLYKKLLNRLYQPAQ